MSRELLKRAVRFMSVVGCSNDDICELCDEIEAYLAQPEPEPVAFESRELLEQRDMLLSLVKNYLKYEIFELQDQGFSKEEILDLSILEPYFKAIKEVEGEDYYP